jgi:hypothetical protein
MQKEWHTATKPLKKKKKKIFEVKLAPSSFEECEKYGF